MLGHGYSHPPPRLLGHEIPWRCPRDILVLMMFSVFAGCIAVPVNLPDAEPFSEKVVHVLESGTADRAYVESSLGEPGYSFADGRFWAYERDRDSSTEWLVCAAIPAGFGAYGGCDVVSSGGTEQHILLIQFDLRGVVLGYQVGSRGDLGVVRSPSSQGSHFLLAEYAPDWDEVILPKHCVAYFIPINRDDEPERSWALSNNDGEIIGSVHRGRRVEQAMRLNFLPGSQTLFAESETVDSSLTLQVTFQCRGGDVVYLTASRMTPALVKLDVATVEKGRTALNGRLVKIAEDT